MQIFKGGTMIVRSRFGVMAAAGALAVAAVPALARTHPTHPTHPTKPYTLEPHKCAAHKIAYIASGTLVTWSATPNSDGTYTGTIVVTVKHANHHAKSTMGTNATFTLTNTKVSLGKNVTAPTAGDTVKLIGKVTSVAKKCSDQSAAGVVTIRKVTVR
jgi:hypothetical protein